MQIEGERFLVTGGAGFLGRHLVPALQRRGASVVVLDRDADRLKTVGASSSGAPVTTVRADLRSDGLGPALRGCSAVFHLAANPDVRQGEQRTREVFEDNVLATARLLDAIQDAGITRFAFPSTSTVYGEATIVPTPEDYSPLAPTSVYGSTKVAGEGLIHGFASRHPLTAIILRLANVVGGGATHGVVYDLVRKLSDDARELEILGRDPGTRKSYVHVDDVVEGWMHAWSSVKEGVETFNVGSEDAITVRELADQVCTAVGAHNVTYRWTGGVDGGGWKGDVKTMALAIDRLKARGWRPRHGSAQSVLLAAKSLASGGAK
ncbi:MAG: NAD-dependent epimerase/dehydratase family protein [Methanobacteriota archaeon]|nr:MAG: NAD-dependent epimerase/dehydratase family protein [Euryarchaeota archaeon]